MFSEQSFQSKRRVRGLTHNFYRYPATTSPEIVRDLVLQFSSPGDVVLDPFAGGGTVIVEALAHGRETVGADVNPLAVLVSKAKTTLASAAEWVAVCAWGSRSFDEGSGTTFSNASHVPQVTLEFLDKALVGVGGLPSGPARLLARCALLSVGRWAVEGREPPDSEQLSGRLAAQIASMKRGSAEFAACITRHGWTRSSFSRQSRILRAPAESLAGSPSVQPYQDRVRLVLTSPPYPGVHVLYHRWQIRGRRETNAPYWIANARDGHGPAHYTLGGRSAAGQKMYFERITCTFGNLRPLLSPHGKLVQIVGFNSLSDQLPRFLAAMEGAGYRADDVLLARDVPNRKWYTAHRDNDAKRELLLVFRQV